MTALLPPLARTATPPAQRRPLLPIALLGGALAAASTLVVCLAVGVVGWYVTDAGTHGMPRDGLRMGALGWLMAHGSGVSARGAMVGVVPLGVTAVCAWVAWRVGYRVGDLVSGNGPDADGLADGERDYTVAGAVTGFAVGYVLVTALTRWLAATPATDPDLSRAVGWSVGIAVLVGGPAIAAGSGRAAIWARVVRPGVVATGAGALRVLAGFLLLSAATLAVGLALDLSQAANVFEQLGTSTGEGLVLALLIVILIPNATGFAGAFLLGPGFAVGSGTVVSPSLVVLGPLPLFPLVAALPTDGVPPSWVSGLMTLPVAVAAVAVARTHRRYPSTGWFDATLRGSSSGVLAGLAVAGFTALAGGAVGPGRMREVAPFALDVLAHAVAACGLGGLIGALVMTAWQRRQAGRATT